MIVSYQGTSPVISDSAYMIGHSYLSGFLEVHAFASIWPGVVARADLNKIVVGEYTNVQDNSVLHVDHDRPLLIGKHVTIGHNAVVHGCTIGDYVLVGIGAIVLNGAVVEDYVLIGAGSVVPEGKVLQSGKLYLGAPARPVRDLTEEEREKIRLSSRHYLQTAEEYTKYPEE